MNNETLYAPVFDTNITMVKAQYHDKKTGRPVGMEYTFKTDLPLKVEDVVIMETQEWMEVGTITEIDVEIPIKSDIKYKWVIGRLDLTAHAQRSYFEAKLINEINRKQIERSRQQIYEALGVRPEDLKVLSKEPVINE